MKKSNIPVFVIHYTKLKDRKEYIRLFLEKYFSNYTFIKKFDKEDIDIEKYEYEYEYEKNSQNFESKIQELWGKENATYRNLSDAEISCFFKHLDALYQASNSDFEYSLIIEDDVRPTRFFNKNFRRLFKIIETFQWDVIFIGNGIGRRFIFKKINYKILNPNPQIINHPASNCADSYIIKKESAKLLLNNLKKFNLSYDWELAYQMYKLDFSVYWSTRPLFFQGSKTGDYKSELR